MDVQQRGAETERQVQDPVREKGAQVDHPECGQQQRRRIHRRGRTPAVQRHTHRGG